MTDSNTEKRMSTVKSSKCPKQKAEPLTITSDSAAHARDFAERHAEPIWLHGRIDAVIAHEDTESLTGDHDFAEAWPQTRAPDHGRGVGNASSDQGETPGSGDVVRYLTVGPLDPEALGECAAVAIRPLDETTVRRKLAEFPEVTAEPKDGYVSGTPAPGIPGRTARAGWPEGTVRISSVPSS